MKNKLYICDSERQIKEGVCKASNCKLTFGDCTKTSKKEYAKEYITIFEAKELFESLIEICEDKGNKQEVEAYKNALKSVEQTISDLKKRCEEQNSFFIDCICKQLSLFEDVK